jgi:GAF domain
MPNPWVAVDAGVDPLQWARLLRRAYNRAWSEGPRGDGARTLLRPVVAESWRRCEQASLDPVERAPILLERDEARRTFARHCLSSLLHIVESVLLGVADYAHQVVLIADADGLILWSGGHAETLEAAEKAHLMPGALWSERAAGTNALGTALVLDHPVQIFSAEHFKESLHGWSSAAAPVHDPETGAILGVLDLCGPYKAAHPHGFSLVAAAARMLEAQLEHEAAQCDERLKVDYLERVLSGCSDPSAVVSRSGRVLLSTPPGWLGRRLPLSPDGLPVAPVAEEVTIERLRRGDGFLVLRVGPDGGRVPRSTLRLEAMGRERAVGALGGRTFEFTRRHSELLVILAHHPDGLCEGELASELYGSSIKSVTIRAEISRLRKLLGPVVRTQPYRLTADVCADFLDIADLLGRGEREAATERCPGPLLPSSTAPGVVEARERIADALGAALQHS